MQSRIELEQVRPVLHEGVELGRVAEIQPGRQAADDQAEMKYIGQRIVMTNGALPTGIVAIVQRLVGILTWLRNAAVPSRDLAALFAHADLPYDSHRFGARFLDDAQTRFIQRWFTCGAGGQPQFAAASQSNEIDAIQIDNVAGIVDIAHFFKQGAHRANDIVGADGLRTAELAQQFVEGGALIGRRTVEHGIFLCRSGFSVHCLQAARDIRPDKMARRPLSSCRAISLKRGPMPSSSATAAATAMGPREPLSSAVLRSSST